jgi:hypothetical protein
MDKDKVVELLERVGTALTTKGEQAFQILVAGVRAEGIADLSIAIVWGVICSATAYAAYRFIKAAIAYNPANYNDEFGFVFVALGGVNGVISVISFLVVMSYGYSAVLKLTAPEYGALLKLVSLVGGR